MGLPAENVLYIDLDQKFDILRLMEVNMQLLPKIASLSRIAMSKQLASQPQCEQTC